MKGTAPIGCEGARLRRGLWPAGAGRLCRRVVFASAQGATAPAALKVADCRYAAMLIKSALRIYFSVSYGIISILRIGSLRSPPPIRLRRTSPRESVSHDSQVALLPYKSSSHSANHVRCASTGKRVTRFSGRFASLQHGYHRLTIFCASLRSFKICSLV